jgi:hypothetical protein
MMTRSLLALVALLALPAAAAASDLDGEWTRDDGKDNRIERGVGRLLDDGEWSVSFDIAEQRGPDGPEAFTLRLTYRSRDGRRSFMTKATAPWDPAAPERLVLDWGSVELDEAGAIVARGSEPRTLRRTPGTGPAAAPPSASRRASRRRPARRSSRSRGARGTRTTTSRCGSRTAWMRRRGEPRTPRAEDRRATGWRRAAPAHMMPV